MKRFISVLLSLLFLNVGAVFGVLIYDIDLETGDLSEFDSDTGTGTQDAHADAANLGSYGFRTMGAGTAYGTVTLPDAECWIGFHFRIDPSMTMNQFGEIALFETHLQGNSFVALRRYASGSGAPDSWQIEGDIDTTNFATNTWLWIKLHLVPNDGSTGGFEMWIDGDAGISNLTTDTSGANMGTSEFGAKNNELADGIWMHFDNILISETEGDIVEPTGGAGTSAAVIMYLNQN